MVEKKGSLFLSIGLRGVGLLCGILTVDVLILERKIAFVYLTPNPYVLHSKVLYTSCIQLLWYADETYLNLYLIYLLPHSVCLRAKCYFKVGEEADCMILQDLSSEPPLQKGDTDKRFSFLPVKLMMSVCSDVFVCVCDQCSFKSDASVSVNCA